jgi:hypothetical protein
MISCLCATLLHANIVKQERQFVGQISISMTSSFIYNHTHQTDISSYNNVILSSCYVLVLICPDFHFSLDMHTFWWHSCKRKANLKEPCVDDRQQNGRQRKGVTCLLWLYSNSSLLLWQMSHLKSCATESQAWNNYVNSIKKQKILIHMQICMYNFKLDPLLI